MPISTQITARPARRYRPAYGLCCAPEQRAAQTAAAKQPLSDEAVDSFIAIASDGTVTGYCGHVDLGTGIATALSQIVAEELDVPLSRVRMVLGDTDRTPDQGPTIASATVQVTAMPLRQAAAQARQFLLQEAARRLDVTPESLTVREGVFREEKGGGAKQNLIRRIDRRETV